MLLRATPHLSQRAHLLPRLSLSSFISCPHAFPLSLPLSSSKGRRRRAHSFCWACLPRGTSLARASARARTTSYHLIFTHSCSPVPLTRRLSFRLGGRRHMPPLFAHLPRLPVSLSWGFLPGTAYHSLFYSGERRRSRRRKEEEKKASFCLTWCHISASFLHCRPLPPSSSPVHACTFCTGGQALWKEGKALPALYASSQHACLPHLSSQEGKKEGGKRRADTPHLHWEGGRQN